MPLIDDRGRLFGRLNIVDFAVVLVVGLLIPLSYGAYLLFRPQPPQILAIEPARVLPGTAQVNVRGEHLRPYLRMTIGTVGTTFLFANPEGGVLQLPPLLPPGSYDVVILDEAQEVGRLSGGLTIEAPSSNAALVAVGTFPALDSARAQLLWQNLQAAGRPPASWGEVIGVQRPEPNVEYLPTALPIADGASQVRAVLRFRCKLELSECKVANVALKPGVTVPVDIGDAMANFRVDELYPSDTTAVEILLRSYLTPEEVVVLRGWNAAAKESFPARAALLPSILSFEVVGPTTDKQEIVTVRVRVPAVETTAGWMYGGRVLRIGDSFVVERPSQQLPGRVVGIRRIATTGTP